ncbi:E3 ubiquitin-protein ligase RHA2B [Ricinus communis]|uniref:E3 ubiquitin-protein ligase RHA2B n=1 Tax=Ricinus communis TaxID=3988 RepID=UPI000772A981|nr:E3 ubiquitin-protein ligase RHA2B [Ricinus communis]|eukprot:XP_015580511.1 E3 ubiquitin-protein ligase RHA2B [Ricinus communis]
MAALSEFLSRLYTITIVFFCLLLLEALILFRSVTGTISNYNPTKRVISTTKYLQLIEEKNPTILYTDKLRQQSATECAVCLSEFSEGEYVRRLMKCKHTFHRDCLDKWLQQYLATCPLCRTKVLPDQIVADFHRLQDNQSINQYYYYDGSDEEMIFLLSALHGNGLHRIF